jgi:hypothetical protein
MMGTGTQQALITVTSEHPCDLGFDPIKFEVEYSDGRSGLVRARPDLSEVC